MTRARCFVVDDSVVARRIVVHVLESDPDSFEVVGTSASAKQGLARIGQLQPDFIILDVEMPDMTGIQALPLIRRAAPDARVIMFSSLTARGAAITLDALAAGASDYVTKPSGTKSQEDAEERIRLDLLPKLKALFLRETMRHGRQSSTSTPALPAITPRWISSPRLDVVAIGASTGGPNALAEVLTGLGTGFPLPIVIVQHMPPVFTRLLAERLGVRTGGRAVEARDGDELRPGGIWIAPGDNHLVVTRKGTRLVLRTHQEPAENFCRPAVDALFRSLASVCASHTLAVVLTGMGQDGFRGCRDIRAAGGYIIAQDKKTSVVWGMPGQVVQGGLADEVVALPEIADRILRRVKPSAEPVPVRGANVS
jgi:two-component system, chemotaxis family, protein-glutamate methylesterase/glutaminase